MAQSVQKGGKGRVGDASSEVATVASNCLHRLEDCEHQLGQIVGPKVSESLLGQFPHAFVGIEFWGVGRKPQEMKSPGTRTELADESAAMRIATVPQHEDVTTDLAQQLSEEVPDLLLSNVLCEELKMKIQSLVPGRHRDPRDDGDAIASVEVMNGGCLADWSPSRSNRGRQLEARLVDEDEVGSQPPGVFFTLGQSSRMKRRISAWLRSSAFFCGFWWLHPNACRSLPT